MSDLPPDVIERAERRINAIFARIIGGVMLWIGVAFVGLFAWASYKIMALNRAPDYRALVLLGLSALLATFCSVVGWRLFLNRPNRFGSILGPLGWHMLGGVFGVLGSASFVVSVVLLRAGTSSDVLVMAVTSVASCAVFCHLCLRAARQAQANGSRRNGAL
jgi:hypothetical protein